MTHKHPMGTGGHIWLMSLIAEFVYVNDVVFLPANNDVL